MKGESFEADLASEGPIRYQLPNPKGWDLQPMFWISNLLHLILPGGIGYQRRLGRERGTGIPDRAALKKRLAEIDAASQWIVDEAGVRRRLYSSPAEYQEHQRIKLDLLRTGSGFRKLDVLEYRMRFWRRFRHLTRFASRDATVLCLGARQGTEVEVLRELGFARAKGVDLNPGPDNPLVEAGDFMAMDRPDSSIDVTYSNCLDHARDLDEFLQEQVRVLKSDGVAIFDITAQPEAGPFEVLDWPRAEEVVVRALNHFGEILLLVREKNWMWMMVRKPIKRDP